MADPTHELQRDPELPSAPGEFFASRRREASARRHLIARVRRSIEADEYENGLKLSVAADRLLDRLFDRLPDETADETAEE